MVDASANAGNPPVESWTGFGHAVALGAGPIVVPNQGGSECALRYVAVDDPHYWRGEIHCMVHPGWFAVIPFGRRPEAPLPPAVALLAAPPPGWSHPMKSSS